MGFNSVATYTLPTVGGDNRGLLFRQAAYPLWLDQSVTTATYVYDYQIAGCPPGVAHALFAITDVELTPMKAWSVGNRVASSSAVGVVGSTPPEIRYGLLGVDEGLSNQSPFFFVPIDWNVQAVVYNSAGTLTGSGMVVAVEWETWTSPGQSMITSGFGGVASVGTNTGVSAGSPGSTGVWVRPVRVTSASGSASITIAALTVVVSAGTLSYVPATGNAGGVVVTAAPKISLLPYFVSPEFANSQLPWFSTRTTAAAALFTNVTQALNKAGSITAGRISPQVANPWTFTKTYLSGLHPAEKALLGLEHGFYTYVPPSTDMSSFWDYTVVTTSMAPCPTVRLDNTSLVNAFVFESPVLESFAINLDWHIEFRTTSTLWQIGLSAITLEAFHQAQIELCSHGFFYNNDDHGKLLKVAKQGFGKLATMATPFLPPAARAALGVTTQLAKLLSSRPPKTPPATTLQVKTKPAPAPKKAKPAVGKKVRVKRGK